MSEVNKELPLFLNFGCGQKKRDRWLNVDISSKVNPDLLWNLDKYPYPLPSDHFEYIHAGDVVEHLIDIKAFMEESHRLLKPDGMIETTTPHFSCSNSFTDPTHKSHLGYFSFDYFTSSSQWNFYTGVRFEIIERFIAFHPGRINRVVSFIANKYPDRYERRLCWSFPAWFLIFKLKAIK